MHLLMRDDKTCNKFLQRELYTRILNYDKIY